MTAFLVTLFAGAATGIGSFIAFFAKTTNKKFLSSALGFSAGIMIYLSFVELFNEALDELFEVTGSSATAMTFTVIAFFSGILLIALIDGLIPKRFNPHEPKDSEEMDDPEAVERDKVHRVGVFTAIAIALHNFPEGFIVFLATLADPSLGIVVAIAIALHNIPEGVAVSVPIYHATGSRLKAFLYSFASGIVQPVGALVGYFVLLQFMNEYVLGIAFAAVAGMMVFISLDQLLPTAQRYGYHHLSIYGLVLGMLVMAVSLILLPF